MTLKEAVVQALVRCAWQGTTVMELTDGRYASIPTAVEALYWERDDVACRLLRFRHVSDLGGKDFTGTTEAEIRTMVNERMG